MERLRGLPVAAENLSLNKNATPSSACGAMPALRGGHRQVIEEDLPSALTISKQQQTHSICRIAHNLLKFRNYCFRHKIC
jgi:hypothetical protein